MGDDIMRRLGCMSLGLYAGNMIYWKLRIYFIDGPFFLMRWFFVGLVLHLFLGACIS